LVWGGRQLAEVLNRPLQPGVNYGESWEVSDHPLHYSVAASAPYTGRTLRSILEEAAQDVIGPGAAAHSPFPWLIKFLAAQDWLSVQVHPDAEAASRLRPGERSKTEAWFVLRAQPGSRIFAGLVPGTTEDRLRAALRQGTVADCVHHFEPRPGDCLFLRAGTVHAVGGGVLMAEIQETSDVTFRLFDWNRRDASGKSRDLHIEEAIASIHWEYGPVQPKRVNQEERQELVRCPHFLIEHYHVAADVALGSGKLRALIVIDGVGRLTLPAGEEKLAGSDVVVLPASLPPVRIRADKPLSLLLCTLP
jgi:mannose-6-phosphate isomerase